MVSLKKRDKITILIFLTIISSMPILTFLIFEYSHAELYIIGLLTGETRVSIDASNNRLNIIGTDFRGFYTLNLAFVVLLFVSIIIFLSTSILLIREGYSYRKSEKKIAHSG